MLLCRKIRLSPSVSPDTFGSSSQRSSADVSSATKNGWAQPQVFSSAYDPSQREDLQPVSQATYLPLAQTSTNMLCQEQIRWDWFPSAAGVQDYLVWTLATSLWKLTWHAAFT